MLKFRTEKVNDHITRIFAFGSERMYLVEGSEKAALLDTGSGFGSLKACVEELTDKPVVVLVTHGHTDHAMGSAEFDDVYMNLEDAYIYGPHGEQDFRLDGLFMSEIKDIFTMEDYIPTAPLSHYKDLKEGNSFDLGGIHIDCYACPGHTVGSLVFLIREDRLLLTGDACNNNTFLFEDYSTGVATYENSLKRLKTLVDGKYDDILTSHGPGTGYKGLIEDNIEVCELIRARKDARIPMEFRGHHGWIAMKDPTMSKGNIVYNIEKIDE